MRTTLTLDDDVAVRLERLKEERGEPFKAIVNEVLRRGLADVERPTPELRYRIQPHDSGRCYLPHLDKLGDALAWAEGDGFR